MIAKLIDLLRPFSFRGKLRLLDRVAARTGTRLSKVHGCTMELDLADHIQRRIYLGCYEPQETRVFKRILKPGAVAVDVGANVGYFTALAATLVGEHGSVVAFEPSPYACHHLTSMICRNKLCHAHAFQCGLSNAPGVLKLFVPPDSSRNHSPTMVNYGGGTPVSVEVRTFDDCAKEMGIKRIDLLKLDVEGHEPRVLHGAEQYAATGRIRNLLVEFNDYWLRAAGSSPEELYEQITRWKFVPIAPKLHASELAGCVHTVWFQYPN